MAIIMERAETHMSFASIASLFSNQFKMNLSTRGVADIVTYWREHGKLRGESNTMAVQSDIVNAMDVVKGICIRYKYSLNKEQLKEFISCISYICE